MNKNKKSKDIEVRGAYPLNGQNSVTNRHSKFTIHVLNIDGLETFHNYECSSSTEYIIVDYYRFSFF